MTDPTPETRERLLADVDEATARYRQFEQARRDTVAAVVAALRAGIPPTIVANRSPFTTTHVRNVARDHGVPPARPGPKSGGR